MTRIQKRQTNTGSKKKKKLRKPQRQAPVPKHGSVKKAKPTTAPEPSPEQYNVKVSADEPHLDSWWYAAHEKELANSTQADYTSTHGYEPGPIGRMLSNFYAYIQEIRENVHAQNPFEEQAVDSLLAQVRAQYPDCPEKKAGAAWSSTLDSIEQCEFAQGNVQSVSSCWQLLYCNPQVLYYSSTGLSVILCCADLDNAFHSTKHRQNAAKLLEFLETIKPGAPERVRQRELLLRSSGADNFTHDELR